MPPGFSLLDALLVSVPLCLALLGFLRGGPAELISCVGCGAALVAAWLTGAIPALRSLGQPIDLLIAGMAGLAVWSMTTTVCRLLRLDTHGLQWGHALDGVTGLSFGAFRGLVLVAAACLFYASALVPVGLANPADSIVYPVFLQAASRLTQTTMGPSPAPASADGAPSPGGVQPAALPHWDPAVRDASVAAPMPAEPAQQRPTAAMVHHRREAQHDTHRRHERPITEDMAARE